MSVDKPTAPLSLEPLQSVRHHNLGPGFSAHGSYQSEPLQTLKPQCLPLQPNAHSLLSSIQVSHQNLGTGVSAHGSHQFEPRQTLQLQRLAFKPIAHTILSNSGFATMFLASSAYNFADRFSVITFVALLHRATSAHGSILLGASSVTHTLVSDPSAHDSLPF